MGLPVARSLLRALLLAVFLIIYLVVGAVVFSLIESPHEKASRHDVRLARNSFLDKHVCVSGKRVSWVEVIGLIKTDRFMEYA